MQKPPRSYTVSVPTKVYLRKFLYAEYGNPIKLDYLTSLGTLVLCLLDNDSFCIAIEEKDKENRIQYMNDKVLFSAPMSTMHWKGHSLSKDKIIAINRYIENEFVKELSFFCKTNIQQRSWRPGIKDAITSFCKKYEIEIDEDVTADALIKAEFRYRKRQEEKKSKNISLENVRSQNPDIKSIFFPSFPVITTQLSF